MSKFQKFLIFLLFILISGYLALIWAKRRLITVAAETARKDVVKQVNQAPLPSDQKNAIIEAVDEILSSVSDGDIDFTFKGEFKDKAKATNIITGAIKKLVTKMRVSEEQKTLISEQIDRFGQAFINDQISRDDITKISKKMEEGQFGKLMALWAGEMKYITPSGLTDDEKKAARVTLARLAKGLKDGKVNRRKFNQIAAPYSETDFDGKHNFKDTISDEEIRSFLRKADELLIESEVPEGPVTFEIGQELRSLLDDFGVP